MNRARAWLANKATDLLARLVVWDVAHRGRVPTVRSPEWTPTDPPRLEGDALDQAIRDAMRYRPWEGW